VFEIDLLTAGNIHYRYSTFCSRQCFYNLPGSETFYNLSEHAIKLKEKLPELKINSAIFILFSGKKLFAGFILDF
jgi:hypothetical protein